MTSTGPPNAERIAEACIAATSAIDVPCGMPGALDRIDPEMPGQRGEFCSSKPRPMRSDSHDRP